MTQSVDLDFFLKPFKGYYKSKKAKIFRKKREMERLLLVDSEKQQKKAPGE